MTHLIMTKGLPASGKTTWSLEQVKAYPGKIKRINKDDLRAMLDGGKWSKGNESFVLDARDHLILLSLSRGFNVIVDDTNLHPKHEERLRELAASHKADFLIQDFTEVDVETCIERDLQRPVSVGEKVIRGMHRDLQRPCQAPLWDRALPTAIICDLDGTLALFGAANPYSRDFSQDQLNGTVAGILERFPQDTIVLCSGRTAKYMPETVEWLHNEGVRYDHLWMRAEGDSRKDAVVKREIYEEHIQGKFNVRFVLDDRDQVVRLWRELGLTCLQVAEGNF